MKMLITKNSAESRERVMGVIGGLDPDFPWQVTVKQYVKPRTLEQNAFLHAVPLKLICDHTGHSIDDMKEYLLGEWGGWEMYEVMGRAHSRPVRRSTTMLNRKEFGEFLNWIEYWAAHTLEMRIPRPDEQ